MKPELSFTPTYKVKKLGGENAANLRASVENVLDDEKEGNKQAIVTSAMRSEIFNTTDQLVFIGKTLNLSEAGFANVKPTLKDLKKFHLEIVKKELGDDGTEVESYIKETFKEFEGILKAWIEGKSDDTELPCEDNDYCIQDENGKNISIVGFGEVLAAGIISRSITALGGEGIVGESLDLSHSVNPARGQDIRDTKDYLSVSGEISSQVISIIEDQKIPVLTGYFGELQAGVLNSVGRGYTDATAGMLSVGLSERGEKVLLEIQKSVKGILSADPRELEDKDSAKLIPFMDYVIANEITGKRGAQAKLLHEQVLRKELQEAGVVIRLFDPFSDDENTGTIIQKQVQSKSKGVEFVGGRNEGVTFSISSGSKVDTEFVEKTLGIVKKYGEIITSSTSETEYSFTLDGKTVNTEKRDGLLHELQLELDLRGKREAGDMEFVEYEGSNATLFCIGQNMKDQLGVMNAVVMALTDAGINIDTVNQSRLQRAITFGLSQQDLKRAINAVHDAVIAKDPMKEAA